MSDAEKIPTPGCDYEHFMCQHIVHWHERYAHMLEFAKVKETELTQLRAENAELRAKLNSPCAPGNTVASKVGESSCPQSTGESGRPPG